MLTIFKTEHNNYHTISYFFLFFGSYLQIYKFFCHLFNIYNFLNVLYTKEIFIDRM